MNSKISYPIEIAPFKKVSFRASGVVVNANETAGITKTKFGFYVPRNYRLFGLTYYSTETSAVLIRCVYPFAEYGMNGNLAVVRNITSSSRTITFNCTFMFQYDPSCGNEPVFADWDNNRFEYYSDYWARDPN